MNRKLGIAQATFYRWKSRYGGLLPAKNMAFKILSDRYRNKSKRYGIKSHIISSIINLKNGFATA